MAKKKMGRPRIDIDVEQFENLCKLQCTLAEIAGWFNCSEDTIERFCKREYDTTFAEIYKIKREAGRISLRRSQFQMAQTNTAMAIFLGKQYLGQSDDPRKYAREESTESKLDRLLDTVNEALISGGD